MFFLHLAHFHHGKSLPAYDMNTFQNNLKKICTSTGEKKTQLQLSRLKLSYFNRDLQIAMRDEGSRK